MDDQRDRPAEEPQAPPGQAANGSRRRTRIAVGAAAATVAVAGVAAGAVELVRSRQAIPEGAIRVNGTTHQVAAAPDTPLLYVLRDELGLHGPKFGCGLGSAARAPSWSAPARRARASPPGRRSRTR